MNINDLKTACELKNWKLEINTLGDFGKLSTGKVIGFRELEVGICRKDYVWIWYTVCLYDESEDINERYLIQRNIYSQNTGYNYKGYKRFRNFEKRVATILNK